MGDGRFSFPACVIAGKRRLDVDDLLMLRKHAFSDGIRTEDDARLLLAIHRACASSCPQWDSYVIESLSAYAVQRLHPRGWLDEANADWLIGALSVDHIVQSPLELEIILHALDMATSAPERLSAFALDQMRLGLTPDSRNAYALGRASGSIGMDLADMHFLWRVLRSACESGRLLLSAVERDVLQTIDAMADPRHHHDGWNALVSTLQLRRDTGRPGRPAAWLQASEETAPATSYQAA